MSGLLAAPVFFILRGPASVELAFVLHLRNGLLLTAVAVLLIGQAGTFIFSLTMLPLGYSLYGCPPAADFPNSRLQPI